MPGFPALLARGLVRRPCFHPIKFHSVSRRSMKIATLQLAPRIGDVEWNINRADELLLDQQGRELRPDILVLPELALTGEYI